MSWCVVHRCLNIEPCLSKTPSLTYPIAVLVNIMQSCAIRGHNNMTNAIVFCLCVILPRETITSLQWVYFVAFIRCDSCSGLSEGVHLHGLQCGTVGFTHRIRYTKHFVSAVRKPLGQDNTEQFGRHRWDSPSDDMTLRLNSRQCYILVEYAGDYNL